MSKSLNLSGRPLHLKIALVKTQVRKCTLAYNKGNMPEPVYYDTVEELNSVICRLREVQRADPLKYWCLRNPSDFECRVYDF